MFKCKVCNRTFKTRQALGGHVSRAHYSGNSGTPEKDAAPQESIRQPDAPQTEQPQQPFAEAGAPAAGAADTGQRDEPKSEAAQQAEDEPSRSQQIREYLKQGYTLPQLTGQFNFKESTVRQEIAKLVQPEGEKMTETEISGDGIPVTRKAGTGLEVLNPEAVLRRYTDGSTEDEIELRGMMKLRAAMLMVMDLVNIQKEASEADSKRIRPILDLMKEAREEQDAAAQRARDSNVEIAGHAADETARQVYELLSRDNARVTGSLDQIKQQIGGGSDDPFSRLLSMMQSIQQMAQMFGMPMGMPGMPGGAAPGQNQQPWQPPAIEYEDVPKNNLQEEKDV